VEEGLEKSVGGTFRRNWRFLGVREKDGGFMKNGGMCCIVCVILMERWLKDLMFLVISLLSQP